MRFLSWVQWLKKTFATGNSQRLQLGPAPFRLQLEILEERAVPAHFYTVSGTADGIGSYTGGSGSSAGNPEVYTTLRGAINAADADPGSTITLPAGTFTLSIGNATTMGEVVITANMTITGAGESTTTIKQTVAGDRVIDVDGAQVGGVKLNLSNVTITGGSDSSLGFTGAGGGYTGPAFGNANDGPAKAGAGGGSLYIGAGTDTVDISDVAFAGNSSTNFGGAILNGGDLTVSSDIFDANGAADPGNGGGGGGGAIATFSTASISDSDFVNNYVVDDNVGGGAIFDGSATTTAAVNFNRFAGNNTATASQGNTLATSANCTINAADNWWDSNFGPGTNSIGGAGTTNAATYLVLTNTASPSTISEGGTSTLTADFIHDDTGANVSDLDPAGDFPAFTGLAVTYPAPVDGTLSGQQFSIQSGGAATATYTGTTPGAGSSSVTVDGVTATATIDVYGPPSVNTNPPDPTVNVGGDTTISAVINAGYPVATNYQWQISTDNGLNWTNLSNTGPYSNATTATLQITNATISLNGDEYRLVAGNANYPDSATTAAASLTVDFPPTISTDPSDQTINAGDSTNLNASATGQPIPNVQWQVSTDGGGSFSDIADGGVYSGANTDSLTISGATAAMNQNVYQAIFSNTLYQAESPSTATTTPATLTVDFAPTVTTNPSNSTVAAGGNTSFSATATGNPAPTAQWEVSTDGGATFNFVNNGGVYHGATSNTLIITGATTAMSGYVYEVVYSNTLFGDETPSTATSSQATLTVGVAPVVSANPFNTTVNVGGNASFTALAIDGSPPPTTVQWQVSGDGGMTFNNVTDGGVYSGATTTTLSITGALASQNGYEYHAVFSNGPNLNATSTAATLTVDFPPSVTTNPTNATTNAGGNASYTAAATGNPPPTVQWQVSTDGGIVFNNIFNGGVYSGTSSLTLDITGATAAMDTYQYEAVFSNTLSGGSPGTATTTAANLTVEFAPTVTNNPSNQTVNAGHNASFTASAAGNPTPVVQWLVSINGGLTFTNLSNGGVYGGATANTLTITGGTASMSGYEYEAVFSNTLSGGLPGTATSTAATLTVDFAPTIITNPSNQTVVSGGNATFTAAASNGNPPLTTVQWQVSINGGASYTNLSDSGVYSGAISPTLTITGATPSMSLDEFRAVFSNADSLSSTTTSATLIVETAPVVTLNPANQTGNYGSSVTFSAQAAGNPAPAVQWQVSTNGGASFTNLSNGGSYIGVTTTTLTVSPVSATLSGYQYRAVFNNGVGPPAASAAATLTAVADSAYAYAAYESAFACYINAYDANQSAGGVYSYAAMNNAYSSFYYAYYAYYYDSIGNKAESESCAFYAYYYGYNAYYYGYNDYVTTYNPNAYNVYYYGYLDWVYSYMTSVGL